MLYLMTFSSHFDAIFANRTLKSAGLDVRLMPVPRAVSASCGTCVYSQCDGVWTELARGPSRGGPC